MEERVEAASTTQTLGEVADPLARLCAEDPTVRERVGRACDTAAQAVITVAERGTDGTDGRDGRDGTDGTDAVSIPGRDGEDGQSPPCLAEPSQCRGTDGRDGTNGTDAVNGTDGRDGRDGNDGDPGAAGMPPVGWTTEFADGSVQTCSRVAAFDPAAPRYSCTVTSPPTEQGAPDAG